MMCSEFASWVAAVLFGLCMSGGVLVFEYLR